LGASLIVAAIHFLSKRKVKLEIPFTNLRLLREIWISQRPKKRFEDLLFLLLRIAAIAAIFLALAKPHSSWFKGSAHRQKGALAASGESPNVFWFVFDLSYSMDYKNTIGLSALELAKKGVQELANGILTGVPNSRIGILSFTDTIEEMLSAEPTGDIQAVKQTLGALKILTRPTDQGIWIDRLKENARKYPTAGVFVFSDFAKHGFPAASLGQGRLDAGFPVILVDASLKDFSNRQLSVNIEKKMIRINARCWGDRARGKEKITVYDALSDRVLSTVSVDACGDSLVPIKNFSSPDKEVVLKFSLDEDKLPLDDSQFLVVPAQGSKNIILVDGEPGARIFESESFYVQEAFKALEDVGRWTLYKQEDFELALAKQNILRSIDELWLLHPQKLSAAAIDAIAGFARDPAKKIVVSLGSKADLEGLSKIFHVSFGAPKEGSAKAVSTTRKSLENFELGSIKVNRYIPIVGNIPQEDVWLNVGDDPLLLRIPAPALRSGTYQVPEGREAPAAVFFYCSSFDLDWGNLPLKGVFYPLVNKLLSQELSPAPSANLYLGETLTVRRRDAGGLPRITAPSGSEVASDTKSDPIKFGPLREIGLYKLSLPGVFLGSASKLPRVLAVRLPVAFAESDLTRAEDSVISQRIGKDVFWKKVSLVDFAQNPQKALALIQAQDFSRYVLFAAFIFLLMESAVSLWLKK